MSRPLQTLIGCLSVCAVACLYGIVGASVGVAFVCMVAGGFGYALHLAAVEDLRRHALEDMTPHPCRPTGPAPKPRRVPLGVQVARASTQGRYRIDPDLIP